MCDHEFVFKDGLSSEGNPFKLEQCKKCSFVKDVLVKELVKRDALKEPKQSVWDLKDRRIARENSLSHATLLALAIDKKADTLLQTVKEIAEDLEKWIYRKE